MIHWTHSDKWERYLLLLKNPEINNYLPITKLFDERTLIMMLLYYPVVYVKPVDGTGGRGIIKIINEPNGGYTMQYGLKKVKMGDIHRLTMLLKRMIKGKSYMIQQGINLVEINHRPIDFRVLILKPYKNWEKIGIIGKVAGKNRFITNKARGGKAISFNDGLTKGLHLNQSEVENYRSKLYALSVLAGNILGEKYRYVREIGMDVGIDKSKRIWIFETNAMPRYELFKAHQNKELYGKIDQKIRYIRRNYKNKRL